MSAIQTAYYDLLGIIYLLNLKDNKKFFVLVHSLARDICLIIYQINNAALGNVFKLDPNIKKIRHKVKLNKGSNNKKIFEEFLKYHFQQFGTDIDNLGFYLDGNKLIGSSIYPVYIFYDTTILNPTSHVNTGARILEFYKEIGELSISLLEKISEKFNYTLPVVLPESFLYTDTIGYIDKDLQHSRLYGDDTSKNVLITRLLLTQQELSTCLWLEKGIDHSDPNINWGNYMLFRLSTIKMDQVMDNLFNMQEYMAEAFKQADAQCQHKLSMYMNDYNNDIQNECSNLRNMIHYNNNEENFYDFVLRKQQENKTYMNDMINKIIFGYMEPLSNVISIYFDIKNKRSMGFTEKVVRRISTKYRINR